MVSNFCFFFFGSSGVTSSHSFWSIGILSCRHVVLFAKTLRILFCSAQHILFLSLPSGPTGLGSSCAYMPTTLEDWVFLCHSVLGPWLILLLLFYGLFGRTATPTYVRKSIPPPFCAWRCVSRCATSPRIRVGLGSIHPSHSLSSVMGHLNNLSGWLPPRGALLKINSDASRLMMADYDLCWGLVNRAQEC